MPYTPAAAASPPNVLFLFADDMRADCIQALGNREIHTPNLDRLVERGLSFNNAYNMGSRNGAVCMPSRAMLMTGQSLFAFDASAGTILPTYPMFPELLRGAGYDTFVTGKWHQDSASSTRAFSAGANIFMGGMHDPFKTPLHDYSAEGNYATASAVVHDGVHATDLFADAAMGFLTQANPTKPFFAYVSFTSPHDPRTAPEAYHRRYPSDALTLPPNYLPEHPFDNGELVIRDEQLAATPRSEEEVRKHLSDYYAMITHVDDAVGRILDALEASGRAGQTIVVFTADHGLAVGSHGLMGKQNLYEHSAKLPLILAGPGIPQGIRSDALVYLSDLHPTLLELCQMVGVATPHARSFAPVLRGELPGHREQVTFYYKEYQRAVRQGDWKLIEYRVAGEERVQLFDLKSDPHELRDRSVEPDLAETLLQLRALLAAESAALQGGIEGRQS